jgi:hypothetical protein
MPAQPSRGRLGLGGVSRRTIAGGWGYTDKKTICRVGAGCKLRSCGGRGATAYIRGMLVVPRFTFVKPALPMPAESPPCGPEWVHEMYGPCHITPGTSRSRQSL